MRFIAGRRITVISRMLILVWVVFPLKCLTRLLIFCFFLESIEWKWDINTLMAQPADLFHAVLRLMMVGNKLKKQAERKRSDE